MKRGERLFNAKKRATDRAWSTEVLNERKTLACETRHQAAFYFETPGIKEAETK